ncbi:hypothetical protein PV04_09865 [Phialophora macrospora]|uniref:Uncharacterized protein n=1 Tax=Phialophora macrospora TaxID=1851006 RepID=A0A0D2CD39_9EURO|nr:hypothetical protein PV04_09865 [Phialophora macrospora]
MIFKSGGQVSSIRMFAVPNAKRVKRSRLFQDDDDSHGSRDSSRSNSPGEPASDLQDDDIELSYGFEYDFVAPKLSDARPSHPISEPRPLEDAEEPEYQFRLFAPGLKSRAQHDQPEPATGDAIVRLSATPEPAALDDALSLDKAHFIRPNRPETYYFTAALPDETLQQLKAEYAAVAVSASDVFSRAESTKWPGTALPWRLIRVQLLNAASKSKEQRQSGNFDSAVARHNNSAQQKARARTRPSKKRRILVRRRVALRNELAAQAKVTEETEREKRTRRNREKKVKKKEREKRKKTEASGSSHGVEPEEGHVESGEATAEPGSTETSPTVVPVKACTNPTETGHPKTGEPASGSASSAATDVRRAPLFPPTRRAPTAAAAAATTPSQTANAGSTPRHPTRQRM